MIVLHVLEVHSFTVYTVTPSLWRLLNSQAFTIYVPICNLFI